MKKSVPILICILVMLFIFTPYPVSNELMNGVNKAKEFWFYGISVLIIFLAVVSWAFKKRAWFRFHIPDVFILLYYLYLIAHIFFTDPVKFHLDKFIIQTLWVVLYFILKSFWGAVNGQSGKYLEFFTIGLMISASGQAVIGLLQLYGLQPSLNSQFQITGSFVNPAPFSFFLGAVFPFALAIYFQYQEKLKIIDISKWFSLPLLPKLKISLDHIIYYISIATLLLILLILPVTMIRTGWLMAITGSAFVLYHQYKPKINTVLANRWIRWMAIPVVLLSMIAVMYGAYVLKKDSADGRALILEITIDKITESPVFGQGFGAFYSQYNNWQADWFAAHPVEKEGPKAMLAGNVKFAYNEFLEIAADLGILGLVLMVLFLAGALKSHTAPEKGLSQKNHLKAILAACIALLVGSWFSYPSYSLPTFVLLLAFISILVGYQKPWKIVKANFMIRLVTLVLVTGGTYRFIQNQTKSYKAFVDWKYANYFLTSNNFSVAIETYEELYPVLKSEDLFLQEYGKALSLDGNYKKSVEILNQATVYGSDIYLYTTLGDNYKALGEEEKAGKAYQKAINMAPHKFYAPYLLAKLHFETGDTITAVQLARELLEKPVKVHSRAIDEIKQEMQDILTAAPINKSPENERAKSSTIRKESGGKDDV